MTDDRYSPNLDRDAADMGQIYRSLHNEAIPNELDRSVVAQIKRLDPARVNECDSASNAIASPFMSRFAKPVFVGFAVLFAGLVGVFWFSDVLYNKDFPHEGPKSSSGSNLRLGLSPPKVSGESFDGEPWQAQRGADQKNVDPNASDSLRFLQENRSIQINSLPDRTQPASTNRSSESISISPRKVLVDSQNSNVKLRTTGSLYDDAADSNRVNDKDLDNSSLQQSWPVRKYSTLPNYRKSKAKWSSYIESLLQNQEFNQANSEIKRYLDIHEEAPQLHGHD